MSIKSTHIQNLICKDASNGELTNDDFVQLIELCGGFLNLKTIASYAKDNNLSYNGVKKCRKITTLFQTKYVIDND